MSAWRCAARSVRRSSAAASRRAARAWSMPAPASPSNGIAADVAIAGGVATIRRLNGKLSSGGALSASGTVGIDAAKGFPAESCREDRRRALHRRPHRDGQSQRRCRAERPAHAAAAALGHDQSRQDRHHRSRAAAGLAADARRQAQERAGRGARSRTRRSGRRRPAAAIRQRADARPHRQCAAADLSSAAGASMPSSAARSGSPARCRRRTRSASSRCAAAG